MFRQSQQRRFPGSPPNPPPRPPDSLFSDYLLVKIGSHEFALPGNLVRQLVPHPDLLVFPNSPDWCSGMLAFANLAVPVLNTHRLLQMPPPPKPPAAVVVEPGLLPEFPFFALSVDRLTLTARIRSHELTPIRASSSLPFRSCVTSTWRGRSRPTYLMNLPALIPVNELHALPALLRCNL